MEPRTIEILSNPDLLQIEDLSLLKEESSRLPYAQSLRALYLIAVHQFDKERYSEVLSETAAYTTDKKILYHLINKKNLVDLKASPSENENKVNQQLTDSASFENNESSEDDFIKDNLNSTPEESQEISLSDDSITNDVVVDSQEEVVIKQVDSKEKNDVTEDQEALDHAKLSFVGISDFLPKVEIKPNSEKNVHKPTPVDKREKHEEEIRRLIAEVEAKMKNKKKAEPIVDTDEEMPSSEINFAENIDFNRETVSEHSINDSDKAKLEAENRKLEDAIQHDNSSDTSKSEPKHFFSIPSYHATSSWDPDSKAQSKPDTEVDNVKEEIQEPKQQEIEPRPFNEFAGSNNDSNVPQFVNTWKNWLKINKERSEQDTLNQQNKDQDQPQLKDKFIDAFIENTPKISRIKKNSTFEVKVKKADISHLMTETLAKLYTQQKHYPKAINAYKVLMEKHPERAQEFKNRIEEISRLGPQ